VESGFLRYCVYASCLWYYGESDRWCFVSAAMVTVESDGESEAMLLGQLPCNANVPPTLLPSTRGFAVRQSMSQSTRYLAGVADRDFDANLDNKCPFDQTTPFCEEFRRPIRGTFDDSGQTLALLTPLGPDTSNQATARGWDTVENRALLWVEDAEALWSSWRLKITETLEAHDADIQCDNCELVQLRRAVAVNDEGWIVVIGYLNDHFIDEADRHRLYLLRPSVPCARAGDLNGDGSVDSPDLLMLLNAWGLCTCPWCPEDLDGDGEVNSADVLILLGNWGGCDEAPMGLPQSLLDCIDRVGIDPAMLTACVSAISEPLDGGSE